MLNSMIKKKDVQLKLPAVELQGIFSVDNTPLVPPRGRIKGGALAKRFQTDRKLLFRFPIDLRMTFLEPGYGKRNLIGLLDFDLHLRPLKHTFEDLKVLNGSFFGVLLRGESIVKR